MSRFLTVAGLLTFLASTAFGQATHFPKVINGPGSTYSRLPREKHRGTPALPYGLALMARFDLLPMLRDSLCLQDSSFDRSGGNDDCGKFYGSSGDSKILADIKGPGCIYRFWSANAAGQLRIFFDGEAAPRIDCPMQDLFLGKVAPFVSPLVGHRSGGWYCFFPIPFQKGCRVEVRNPGNMYYQVQYQRFHDGERVRTFALQLTPSDRKALATVLNQWSHLGAAPVPESAGPRPAHAGLALAPGVKTTALTGVGPGVLTSLAARVTPADRLSLRQLVLRVYWDDAVRPGIEAPIGDFFGAGFGDQRMRALPCAMTDNGFVCYWPMPFRKRYRVELENFGQTPLYVSLDAHTGPLRTNPSNVGYFNAQWHRQTTVSGDPFHILHVTGRGHYVGEHTDMQGDRGIGFLEGDEQIRVDGQSFPSIHGTGTEDFYTSGWYFDEGPFNLAYHGCTIKQEDISRVAAYRFQIQDCVPFQNELTVDIEHGGGNDYPGADYSCVAYWYQTSPDHDWSPITADRLTPARYSVSGAIEAESLTWDSGTARVIDDNTLPIEASGGKVVAVTGENARFTVDAPREDIYTLEAAFLRLQDSQESITITGDGGVSAKASAPSTAAGTPAGRWLAALPVHLRSGAAQLTLHVPQGKSVYLDYIRLVPSRKVAGALEAETLPGMTASPGDGLAVFDAGDEYSGRRGRSWRPAQQGNSLQIPIEVTSDGAYSIEVGFGLHDAGLVFTPSLDGVLFHSVDTFSARPGYTQQALGRADNLTKGAHMLNLTFASAPASVRNPELRLDYVRLRRLPYPGGVEAETLKVLDVKGGGADRQPMESFGSGWSGDEQLFFRGADKNSEVTLELPVEKAGAFRFSVCYTTAPDYGIVQALIDGQPVGSPTDNYTSGVRPKGKLTLGSVTLTAGVHRLTFRVTGKNETSAGYFAGIDAVVLEPGS